MSESQDPQKPAVIPPAAKAAQARQAAEAEKRRQAQALDAPNPSWWAPVFVTLLLVGLLWIVVFYISQGQWPVAAFNYWNLVVGFALLIAGFGMTMKWK